MGKLDEAKHKVLDIVPIRDLIAESVQLSQRGARPTAKCPFHDDNTPSFTVFENNFYCFGCKASGNAIDFVMRHKNFTYVEALKHLADKYGIDISKYFTEPSKNSEQATLHNTYYDVLARTHILYQKNFWSDRGKIARDYLASRGFTEDQARQYEFGCAFDQYDQLVLAFDRRTWADLEVNYLARPSRSRPGTYIDFFRNRLMIPIKDSYGRVVAFSGRTLGDDPRKYLNSGETPLFEKSKLLFGFHFAREAMRQKHFAFVVEGPFDAMSLWRVGIHQAVAIQGSAFTEKQIQLLNGMVSEVFLLFDADQGGETATLRSIQLALKYPNLRIRVVRLPDGLDPDEYVSQNGAEALLALKDSAVDLMDYAIQHEFRQAHGLQIIEVIKQKMMPWIVQIQDGISRQFMITRIAQLSGVSQSELQNYLEPALRSRTQVAQSFSEDIYLQTEESLELGVQERELLGHIYFSSPEDGLSLETIKLRIRQSFIFQGYWAELIKEFLVCLEENKKPSDEPATVWKSSVYQNVLQFVEALAKEKKAFITKNRNHQIEKIFLDQDQRRLKDQIQNLKREIPKVKEDRYATEELLSTIQKLNRQLLGLEQKTKNL